MTELKQESMYELATRIPEGHFLPQAGPARLQTRDVERARTGPLVAGDLNNLRNSVNQMNVRLERIETRLELRELAESQARFEPHP